MQNEKCVPTMDFTYVCFIIRGTIKKIKTKFMQGARPSHRAKNVRDWTKIDLHG